MQGILSYPNHPIIQWGSTLAFRHLHPWIWALFWGLEAGAMVLLSGGFLQFSPNIWVFSLNGGTSKTPRRKTNACWGNPPV